MISERDQKIINEIEEKWCNFSRSYRNRDVLDQHQLEKEIGPDWIPMLEREKMLSELVRILKSCKVIKKIIKNRVIYE